MKTSDFIKNFKYNQALFGGVLILFLVWFGFHLNGQSVKLSFSLLAGFLLGYSLTRSRFGFAGGVKRIYVRGEGSLSKALIFGFVMLTIIYGVAQWVAASKGAVPSYLAKAGQAIIPGTQNVYMANLGTVAGAFIFGVGMIIAGGCASGTLADLGEGEGHAMIAFPMFILGTIPGHYLRAVIDRNPIGKVGVKAYLPDYFGYLGAILVTCLGLLLLYVVVRLYERKRKAERTYLEPTSDYEDFEKELTDTVETPSMAWSVYHKLFVERWSFVTGATVLGIVSTALFIFNGKAWGVTSAFTNIAVWFLGLFGIHFGDKSFDSVYKGIEHGILSNSGVILDIGIILGSFAAFLLAGRFKLSLKFNSKNAMLFAFGGLCMGFGSRLAKGCNIGALYSSLPNLSISAWVFLLFISLGAVFSLKVFKGGRSCLVPNRHRNPKDF